MGIVFQCDCCKKNYNSEFTSGIKFYSKELYQNSVDSGVCYDLCKECKEKVINLLREIKEENENVEKETFEEVDTDVKEMSIEDARKILESEWCCKCRRYTNGKCDRRLSKGIKNCIDYVLENKIPKHFYKKVEPEKDAPIESEDIDD
ncbi:MAG: hypothetical protein J6D28_02540 [Bacilli bacterium]|nr:hypothetical protein [Bacilli bacterium]